MVLIILILCAAFVIGRFSKKGKRLSPLGTITVCTGAVKTGKTTLAVYLALCSYLKVYVHWWFATYILRKNIEKPLLYSNLPLKVRYVPLTTDILLRKERQAYGSVTLIDEASLVADSQLIKDKEVNMQLLLYFKLYGHATKGGTMIIDTQAIQDVHYIIKRSISSYIWISKTTRWLPFVLCSHCVEQRYSEDGTIISTETDDIDNRLKRIFIPKLVWRFFDTYAFSLLTDHLPLSDISVKVKSLKTTYICSFRKEFADMSVKKITSAEINKSKIEVNKIDET